MGKNFTMERGLIFGFTTMIETPKHGAGFKTDGRIDMSGIVAQNGISNKEIYRITECTYVVYEDSDNNLKIEARRDADNNAIAEAVLEMEKRIKKY